MKRKSRRPFAHPGPPGFDPGRAGDGLFLYLYKSSARLDLCLKHKFYADIFMSISVSRSAGYRFAWTVISPSNVTSSGGTLPEAVEVMREPSLMYGTRFTSM